MASLDRVRPATAADVAARAGVSRASVSQILSGRISRFPEETQQKVRKAASELNYSPWASGRSLVKGRSDTIVLLLSGASIGSMRLQETIEKLTKDFAGPGANVVLRIADHDPDVTVASVLKLQPLAVVDLGAMSAKYKAKLQAHGVATVPDIDQPIRYHGMTIDVAIGDLQVGELTRNGDRQIVYAALADTRDDTYGPGRWAALQGACQRRGLASPLRVDIPLDPDEALEQIKTLGPGQYGFAAYNDEVGAAVLGACTRAGLRVPEDASVIGVDNSEIARLWIPRLTSVGTDMGVFIDLAIGQLRAQLDGRPLPESDAGDQMLHIAAGAST